MASICKFCDDSILIAKHFMLTCPALEMEQTRLRLFREKRSVTLEVVLGRDAPVDQGIEFLKRSDVYNI